MAKLIPELPGRPSRYPWDEWLDGRARSLVKGEDFSVSVAAIRTAAYSAAKKRGMKLTANETPDGLSIRATRE